MMTPKFLKSGSVAVAAIFCSFACGSDDDSGATGDNGGGPDAGTAGTPGSGGASGASGGGGTPGGGGASATGGSSGSATGGAAGSGGAAQECDTGPCEGRMFMGTPLPTCCMDATTCGVGTGGNCFDPSLLDGFSLDGGIFGPPETIVEDPDCMSVDTTFMGMQIMLAGCCDESGVCGVAVEAFSQCITPGEASMFGGGGVDAGAEVPCEYSPGADGG